MYRGVDLTLSGGTASITADKGYGIETNAASAIVQIAGAGSTTVTSNSTFAILADSGSVNLYGTGKTTTAAQWRLRVFNPPQRQSCRIRMALSQLTLAA